MMNLLENTTDEGRVAEDEEYGDYNEAEYGQEEGDQVSCVVHKILGAARQPD